MEDYLEIVIPAPFLRIASGRPRISFRKLDIDGLEKIIH